VRYFLAAAISVFNGPPDRSATTERPVLVAADDAVAKLE
jgi:hypothetical protein